MAINPETGQIEKLNQMMGQLVRPDGSPVPQHWTVLKEGELVEMKGYTWKVVYFNEQTVVLEPVKPETALSG